ncbi:hypothetical protein ACJX0J_034266, partial [Zea mays]
RVVFCRMETRDMVSWNTLMAGLVLNGRDLEALKLFHDSRSSITMLTESTYSTVIKLCANLKHLGLARQLHSSVLKRGFHSYGNVMTALMDAYSKAGQLDKALDIFLLMSGSQNVVSWTAMINGCIQNGDIPLAAALFSRMREDGVAPNDLTYSTILTVSEASFPPQSHAQVIKTNYECTPIVGTALMVSYSKLCGTEEALSIFKMIDQKDVVSWSAMLTCYAQAGDCNGATNAFIKMSMHGLKPNEFTISSAIDACASPAAGVDLGRQFHAISIRHRCHYALCVSSALVSMYARKGSIENAQCVFEKQTDRDLVSGNSMLSGYAQHGYNQKALDVFRQMEVEGIEMDGLTFLSVIMGCTHAGLVEEDYEITPTMDHYACMVDLYSHAGKLDETMSPIEGMPFPAGPTIWRTLLGA